MLERGVRKGTVVLIRFPCESRTTLQNIIQSFFPMAGKPGLLLVKGELFEIRSTDDETVASILFEVQMRGDIDQKQTQQAQKIRHFRLHQSTADSFWVLAGDQ